MRIAVLMACVGLAWAGAVGCAGPSTADVLSYKNHLLEMQLADKFVAATPSTPEMCGIGAGKGVASLEAGPVVAVEPRSVVYTGAFTLLVADVAAAVEATRRMGESLGGYLQCATTDGVVIRVPAARFEEAVAALPVLGTVTQRRIEVQDVTEACEDLEIRLKSCRVLLDRLLVLQAQADNVKDAVEVEREVARVREEIEKLEGRKNRLANRVAYATLSVSFVPIQEAPSELKASLPFGWLRGLGLDHLAAAFER